MRIKIIAIIGVLLVGGLWYKLAHQEKTTPAPAPSFNKQLHSIDQAASPWVVVNKKRILNPKNYEPKLAVPKMPLRLPATREEMHVSTQMVGALEQLVTSAKQAGFDLMLASGYRSYSVQSGVYNQQVKNLGKAKADTESARPGHSEHQTGLGADLGAVSRECEVETCFGDMPEGKWLAANAHKFGFILRYAPGKQGITGYNYEPWHIRYVGRELANEMHNKNIATLEEFFGLPAAPRY